MPRIYSCQSQTVNTIQFDLTPLKMSMFVNKELPNDCNGKTTTHKHPTLGTEQTAEREKWKKNERLNKNHKNKTKTPERTIQITQQFFFFSLDVNVKAEAKNTALFHFNSGHFTEIQ